MSYDPSSLPTTQTLFDYAAIQRELRARDIVRTNNSPVGDIAEAIVAAHYGGTRGSFEQAGWDVLTPGGEHLQVKGMRRTSTTKRRNFSVIRDRDYDAVIIVILDEDYRVKEGLCLERATVEALFPHRDYVNGRIVTVTQALRADPGVEVVELSDALLDAPYAGQHHIH